jgi:hypothetical protein
MHRALRFAVLIGASMLALAIAGSALAAYTPRLVVSHAQMRTQGGGATTITVRTSTTDDSTAKATIYVPQGYTGVFSAPVGTQVGTVSARVQATAISNDTVLPLTGVIQAADPANATIAGAALACTGTTTHGATWNLVLQASGQTLNVPFFVDVITAGPEATFAQYKMQVCLPPPATATFGANLIQATLVLNSNILTTPASAGNYPWRAFFTPYSSRTGPINPAGTVEGRSPVLLSTQLTLNAKITNKKKKIAGFSGTLSEFQSQIAGATVNLLVAGKKQFSTKTKAGGKYSFSLKKTGKRKSTTRFQAQAVVPERDVTATNCAPIAPVVAPGGCVTSTRGAFTVLSPTRSIRL